MTSQSSSSSSSSSRSSAEEVKAKSKSKRDASPKKKKQTVEKKAKPASEKKASKKPSSPKKQKAAPKRRKTSNPAVDSEKPKKTPAKRPKQLRYVKTDEKAVAPKRATAESAGYDLCSLAAETFEPGECRYIGTGLMMAIPAGHFGRICSRSGLAGRGLQCTTAGVIDADFRGEVLVQLINTTKSKFSVDAGQPVAQMIVTAYEKLKVQEVKSLGKTKRGAGGFGSTDKKKEGDEAVKKASESVSASSEENK